MPGRCGSMVQKRVIQLQNSNGDKYCLEKIRECSERLHFVKTPAVVAWRSVFASRRSIPQGRINLLAGRQTSPVFRFLRRWVRIQRGRNIRLLHQAAAGAPRVCAVFHCARGHHQDFTRAGRILTAPYFFFSNRHDEFASIAKLGLRNAPLLLKPGTMNLA